MFYFVILLFTTCEVCHQIITYAYKICFAILMKEREKKTFLKEILTLDAG